MKIDHQPFPFLDFDIFVDKRLADSQTNFELSSNSLPPAFRVHQLTTKRNLKFSDKKIIPEVEDQCLSQLITNAPPTPTKSKKFGEMLPCPFPKHLVSFFTKRRLFISFKTTLEKTKRHLFHNRVRKGMGQFPIWRHNLLCMHVYKGLTPCRSVFDVKSGIDPPYL